MEQLKSYSGLFIIDPEKEEAFEEVKGSINGVITEYSGKIEKEEVLGKRKLAYPIKKNEEGVYYRVYFTARPEGVPKMSRQFRITSTVLRYLIDKEEK
jgi:small subunit ribosomal protein S6